MALGRLFDDHLNDGPPPAPEHLRPKENHAFRSPSHEAFPSPAPVPGPSRNGIPNDKGKSKVAPEVNGRAPTAREVIELDEDDVPARLSLKRPRDSSEAAGSPSTKRQHRDDAKTQERAEIIIKDSSPPVAGPSAPKPPMASGLAVPSRPLPTGKDLALVQIIDIVPDVLPSYALQLYEETFASTEEKDRVTAIIDHLLTQSDYAKVEKDSKGKGKAQREATPALANELQEGEKRWLAPGRPPYADATLMLRVLEILSNDFTTMSKTFIKRVASAKMYLVAPSWLALQDELKSNIPRFQALKIPRRPGVDERDCLPAGDIKEEWAWLRKYVAEKMRVELAEAEEAALEAAEQTAGMLIECQVRAVILS